jgi:CheY-like chemotaxis protein
VPWSGAWRGACCGVSVVMRPEVKNDTPSLFTTGEVLNETYEIRRKIGRGGMGEVYEAYDRSLGRRVAVKAAVPGIPGSVHKEARALAALRHPGIVTVHAVGEHGGIAYVVMERIQGKTLEATLDARRAEGTAMPIEEVAAVLVGIAEALAVVHQAGMAHCDVKPANVILAPGNRVVLTDFGIFQAEIDVASGAAPSGSPNYMAPEAIADDVHPGDLHLVDVYALGVVAFELATGILPYDDDHVMMILCQHVTTPVPDLRLLRPDAPPKLAHLVGEMLAKDPKTRPSSMDEIAWQLRRLRAEAVRAYAHGSVVIAEDNPATAAIVASIVSEVAPDVEIRIAGDGRSALGMVEAHWPELLVVDLHLPDMTGVEVCTQLRGTRMADRGRVVATSAQATAVEVDALRGLGFVRYLPKGEQLAEALPGLVRSAERRGSRVG